MGKPGHHLGRRLGLAVVAAAAASSGIACDSDVGLANETKDGDVLDPDDSAPPTVELEGFCVEAHHAETRTLPRGTYSGGQRVASDTGAWCWMTHRFEQELPEPDTGVILVPQDFSELDITTLAVLGRYDSVFPGEDVPVRVVALPDTALAGEDHQYPLRGNFYSGYLTPSEDPAIKDLVQEQWDAEKVVWAAYGWGLDLGTLNACDSEESCSWYMVSVEIRDPARALDDRCNDYKEINVCATLTSLDEPKYSRTAAHEGGSTAATCTPGHGRFVLLPVKRGRARDSEERGDLVLRPIQASGSSPLTDAARVTRVLQLGAAWEDLRVADLRRGRLTFDEHGRVPTGRSLAVPTTPGGLVREGPAALGGAVQFVAGRGAGGSPGIPDVEIEWTCADTPGSGAATRPAGFEFSLAGLGCELPLAQRFSLDLDQSGGADVARVRLYGQSRGELTLPLARDEGGLRLRYAARGLSLAATLSPATAGQGLRLQLEQVDYLGRPACPRGIHLLPAGG